MELLVNRCQDCWELCKVSTSNICSMLPFIFIHFPFCPFEHGSSKLKMKPTPTLRMQVTRALRSGGGPDPKNGVYVELPLSHQRSRVAFYLIY